MTPIANKRITVAGLGRFGGGIAVARWLVSQGAEVLVTDIVPAIELVDSLEQLAGLPITYRLGGHHAEDFTQADLVVASPAIPRADPFLAAAQVAGVPVTTEIRFFVEQCPAPIVGVTGTKGKSTTTILLGRMLETQYKTWVGGNIGGSLLESLPQIEPSHRVVLELSSYMLDYLGQVQWSPHLALVTMVAADHLAWHGSVEAYQDAKKNIMRFQRPDDVAVLNAKDEGALSFAGVAKGRVVTYPLADSRPFDLVLPGAHNQLNAQGAFAAASMLGIEWDAAQAAIADFPGLPHRLQLVHETGGVRFYNDSIATIPEAAVAALASFDRKTVVQIVGGYDAHAPLTELCNALTEQAKAVLCIGATGPQIAAILAESVSQTPAAVYECGDLPTAVTIARKIAAEGDIVLLSTGCKSYDQFANFEKRGARFVELVKESGNK